MKLQDKVAIITGEGNMIVVILLLLFLTSQVHAQVNIEPYRGRAGITGGVNYRFNTDLGNVDVINSGGAGNITINTDNSIILSVFKGGIGFLRGKRFANNGVIHLRYTWKKHPVYQPEGFLQGDYAKSRKLDWRTLIGAGLRFRLKEGETWVFSFGNSLMWERERLGLSGMDPHPDFTSVIRSSNYLNLHLQGRVTFSITAYYQFMLTDPGDVRILGTTDLTTPIIGLLHQTTSIDFRTDTDPPMDVKKTDVKLSTSLGFRF